MGKYVGNARLTVDTLLEGLDPENDEQAEEIGKRLNRLLKGAERLSRDSSVSGMRAALRGDAEGMREHAAEHYALQEFWSAVEAEPKVARYHERAEERATSHKAQRGEELLRQLLGDWQKPRESAEQTEA